MNETVFQKWPKQFLSDDKLMAGVGKAVIETARMFNTPLILKENGKIKEISPAAMKRRLAKRK